MAEMGRGRIVNCALCGTPCKIVGNVTMNYEPIHSPEITVEDLRRVIVVNVKKTYDKKLKTIKLEIDDLNKLAQAIVERMKR